LTKNLKKIKNSHSGLLLGYLSINTLKAEYNEHSLLKGLANNDSSAVETLYKRHFGMIQHFVTNNNGSFDDARDIFQEAMIALYEKVQNDSFTLTCQIKTYLFSICKNLWLKRLQQMGKYSSPLSSEDKIATMIFFNLLGFIGKRQKGPEFGKVFLFAFLGWFVMSLGDWLQRSYLGCLNTNSKNSSCSLSLFLSCSPLLKVLQFNR